MDTDPRGYGLTVSGRRHFLVLAASGLLGGLGALTGCAQTGNPPAGTGLLQQSKPPAPRPTGSGAAGTAAGLASPSASPSTMRSATVPATPGDTVYVALRSDAARRTDGAPALDVRAALGGFGLDMLRAVTDVADVADVADKPGNTVISPYSLYTVLAMARAGARGRTADQLDALLRASGTEQGGVTVTVDRAVETAVRAAQAVGGADAAVVRSANQVWVQDGFTVRADYLDALASNFGVEAVAAQFRAASNPVRLAINTWVTDRTAGLITDLFGPGSITSDTRLVLVNALYFKAQWARPLRPPMGSESFTTAAGRTVRTPMMLTASPLRGTTGDGWAAVTLPYVGDGLAMTVLVPEPGAYAQVLETADDSLLTAAQVHPVSGAGAPDTASKLFWSKLPPFRVRSAPDVLWAVENAGVTDLFDPNVADLSGVTGNRDLYASSFVHQAVISVDQHGTEAAAATGMGMDTSSAPGDVESLVVDRPFLYWIADTVTGAPLFLGTVTDPTA